MIEKLIFFDYDDTLLDFQSRTIPSSALEALDALKHNESIVLGIASGRGHFSIRDQNRQLPMQAYVGVNGQAATIFDEIVLEKEISQADVSSIYKAIEKRNGSLYIINSFHGLKCVLESSNPTIIQDHSVTRLKDYGPWFENEAKAHIIQGAFEEKYDQWFKEAFPHLSFHRYYNYMVDIFPKNMSKLEGIAAIAQHVGLSLQDVIAIGDGENDIEMLKGVGYGIAMGNASQRVKDSADYITTSILEDGIQQALKHLKLI
jgi:Cof subfamily protein (haloacid dehalogenase superfamily)